MANVGGFPFFCRGGEIFHLKVFTRGWRRRGANRKGNQNLWRGTLPILSMEILKFRGDAYFVTLLSVIESRRAPLSVGDTAVLYLRTDLCGCPLFFYSILLGSAISYLCFAADYSSKSVN